MASGLTVQKEELTGRVFHLSCKSQGWRLLRSQGCNSAVYHSWDVHVGRNRRWSVGVCLDSDYNYRGYAGYESWFIEFYEDEYRAVSSSGFGAEQDWETSDSEEDEETSDSDEGISEPEWSEDRTVLSVNQKLRRIRVQLDPDRGQLSFSDPDSNTHLHTFTQTFTHTFTHTLFPCIYNGDYNADDGMSLKMLQGPMERRVQRSLVLLKNKLKCFDEVKENYDKTEKHIKVQARNTETQIKKKFQNLRRFLQEEEEARIAALREEEAQKSQEMKERTEVLSREMETLSDAIRAAEDQLRAGDQVSFLQNYKTTMEGVQLTLQDPPLLSGGPLIDQAKHLGNLTFRVWDKMKDIISYTPVILDPNTANRCLMLSDDLTGARRLEEQQQLRPVNPERDFSWFSNGVLGSEGFNSGSHSWDVEVGDNPCWSVGVLTGVEQYRCSGFPYGFIRLCYGGRYETCSSSVLSVDQAPRRIRVQLDWDRGQLSFSDPDSNTHLHTYTHTFTERLFPYLDFGPRYDSSLKMLPGKICVTLENHS